MNQQIEAVAKEIYEHRHTWCEFEDETGVHIQCIECGHVCTHERREAVEYTTLACNGAFGYYEPPEEVTEWRCTDCGTLVPPPPVEPGTDDDDLPF